MQKQANSYQKTKSRYQTQVKQNQLYCKWLQKSHRDMLISRLKSSNQPITQINQGVLMKQHYKHWLQLSKSIHLLLQHPLLTKKDFNQVDHIIQDAKQDQLKHGFYGMAGTWLFYMIFLRRFPTMQRIFNQRDRRIRNWSLRIFAGYSVFLAWVMSLNSYNEDFIQKKVKQKGLYKKYHLKTEDVNA